MRTVFVVLNKHKLSRFVAYSRRKLSGSVSRLGADCVVVMWGNHPPGCGNEAIGALAGSLRILRYLLMSGVFYVYRVGKGGGYVYREMLSLWPQVCSW
jgi:hypothetical protein